MGVQEDTTMTKKKIIEEYNKLAYENTALRNQAERDYKDHQEELTRLRSILKDKNEQLNDLKAAIKTITNVFY